MYFLNIFFLFVREEKSLEFIQVESRQPGSLFFFGLEVPVAFYSPDTLYKLPATL